MLGFVRGAILTGSAVVALGSSPSSSWASVAEEQITGVFSDPLYAGYIDNTPAVGAKTYYDNSATAPASTTISGGTLTWGTNPPTAVGTNYSTLTFTGNYVPFADQTSPLQLGTITYTNGTSALNSIIFGATLTFYLGGAMLGSDQVIITTTSNQSSGTSLTQPEAQLDADYINICGNSSNICAQAIQAYENTEGTNGTAFSNPVVAALMGTYTVDPGITLTDVTYQSGDGVVTPRPPEAVPEPSTWAMMGLGFAGLAFAGYRSRRTAVSVA